MTERFFYFFNTLKATLDSSGVFLCCLLAVVVAFIVVTVLSIFKCEYGLKKRIWFFMICLSFVVLQLALCFFDFDSVGYALLSLALYSLFCIPILSVRKKQDKSGARQFAKFLDGRVQKELLRQNLENSRPIDVGNSYCDSSLKDSFTQDERARKEQPARQSDFELNYKEQNQKAQTKKVGGREIDFTHVKNVLSRLDFYGLLPNEKKTVSDLEKSIAYAEIEGADEQIRVRINDGLGALLKIMSKYGI